MKPGGNRRKDELQNRTTSLYRSVSSPVIVASYEKYMERREEVVVGGYGLPPRHSPDVTSPAMAIYPGYQERVSGAKGRRRPSRKTRQSVDGYGSSPDAHGTSPPYRNDGMTVGVNKTQAEQVDKEQLVQGTNNYESLLLSPSPSSIPNPSFTMKYAYDFPAGLHATSQATLSQSPFANDSNYVQLNPPPPSPGFLSDSNINSVKMHTTLGTLISSISPRFDGSRRESLNPLVMVPNHDDFSDNGYVDHVEPTAVATLMPGFLSGLTLNSLEMNSTASTQQDCSVDLSVSPRIDLDNGCFPNPSLSVDSPTLISEDDPAVKCIARQLPAIGVSKTKVKPANKTTKGTSDSMLLRRHGMPALGTRQLPSEKGLKKVPLSRLPGSLPVNFARTVESSSHWKIVSASSVQETPETTPSSVVSLGYNSNEELLGSPNGSRSCLLGSSYWSPRRSGTDGNQPGSTSVPSTSPAKLYPEHWSPEEVNRAMEEGRVFSATLRVNSHNRNEAYVTIDGIPRDILIDGSAAQNRAMEGDSVAVLLEQPSVWPRFKGGNNKQMSNESRASGEVVLKHSEAEKEIVQLLSGLGDNVPSSDGFQEQHALGFSSTDQAESMVRDLGANAVVPQLQQMNKDVHHLNYTQKDPGVGGSPCWQESSKVKASVCSTGQLDWRAEVTHKMVLQTLMRPSNESAPEIGHPQQDGLQSKRETGEAQLSGRSGSVLALKEMQNKVGVTCSNADMNGKVAVADLASLVMSLPSKRPAGKVVAILEKSFRWETVVGFLEFPARAGNKCGPGRGHAFNIDDSPKKRRSLMLVPVDNRCPKMVVSSLPDNIHQRLWDGDSTLSNELLAAEVDGWRADSQFPVAVIKQSLGQGGDLGARQRAILYEHAISSGKFSTASLACLPKSPWKMPVSEMKRRKNLLHLRVFSVVRSAAQDCAHALSIESLPDGAVRVGMHVADVSYFVHPGTALDQEAQKRSTSVSFIQRVLPMLPHVLCEDLCSLNPAVDRLAFSVMWDMNDVGDITNEWIGRTIVHSCAKLTYGHVQTMMDEVFPDFEGIEPCEDMLGFETELPRIYGGHKWMDLVMDVRALHRIATKRRASRFEGGALELDQSKLVFTLEEDGTPYESTMYNTKDSNLVVKEFMLLANMTVARVISNTFPDSALLRHHPKPSPRKLKEFEDFCSKIGIDIDANSAGALNTLLRNMQESVKHDPVLYSILMQYAAKLMQSARYFCSGEFKEKEEWAHCGHAIPLYTHFTSPMQRYPDIVVHRTLAAALEAEEALGNRMVFMPSTKGNQAVGVQDAEKSKLGVPTDILSESGPNSMPVSQEVLAFVSMKHKLPGSSELMTLTVWCNKRRIASRSVKEASIKLNIWAMLKKNKQGLLSNARVLALGPKFMSLYICKFAMERRIYYEDIEGVTAEWFEATGTLVLDISSSKNTSQRRANHSRNGKPQRTVADIAMLVNPTDSSSSSPEQESYEDIIREVQERLAGKVFTDDVEPEISGGADQLASNADVEPTVFPLTLRSLSSVPVSLHAIGGDNRPMDFAARLYVSSYTTSA